MLLRLQFYYIFTILIWFCQINHISIRMICRLFYMQ